MQTRLLSASTTSQIHNSGFSCIAEHCNMLTPLQELYWILTNSNFSISQANWEQVILDLIKGFSEIIRKDGTHYIDHLLQTLKNTKKYDDSFDCDSILIALLHDSIEDTEETFESIRQKYWDTVALWVQALSKKAFWEYIPQWDSSSNVWTEETKDFSFLKEEIEAHIWKRIDHDFKLSDHLCLPLDLRNKWEDYEEKYKKVRNKDYFSKFESLDSLKKSIINEAKINEIELSEWEIDLLTYKVATVKLADRLHNIKTLPPSKMKAKINETYEYLENIWKELWWHIWVQISKEMIRLSRISTNQELMEQVSS